MDGNSPSRFGPRPATPDLRSQRERMMTRLSRLRLRTRFFVPLFLTALSAAWAFQRRDADWTTVPIPETWKRPPKVRPAEGSRSGRDGYAWYRCAVEVPADWGGRSLALFVEPLDDARAAFVNGRQVGAAGTFPPNYRSGLGEPGRYAIPEGVTEPGGRNVIAVRVYYNDGRSNFGVAAPSIFDAENHKAIKMEGPWEYRPGDDPDWALGPVASAEAVYDQVDRFEDLEAYLKRRAGDTDSLTPREARDAFEAADDLKVDLVLSETEIAQPLQVSFDERGRLWVVEYRQYPDPAGLTMVSRDKYLRTVYDKTPEPPPHGEPGRDRISIHEDRDGDGVYEHHQIFVDGLNLATAAARGRGGVFVLNPPYLLFYEDRDGDDRPDGDPEVRLKGFGLEDTHSICSNLVWGPDGWLYASQGSTVSGDVRRPDQPEEEAVHSMGQHIWRYHPETRRYEIFAEGGGNTFGVEIDRLGRVFSGHNGGDTRGFHYVQGGYYQKGFSKHGGLSNPYSFGYFPAMKHHQVPRFTHTFLIYEGAALPERYHGRLFGVEPLQGQVVVSAVEPDGSTLQTRDLHRPLTTEDPWFRPVDIKHGPDGAVYIADFYEQRIDHSSHYAGRIDRTNGRVYRLSDGSRPTDAWPWDRAPRPPFDLAALSGDELIDLLDHPNRWFRRMALRVLGDRKDESLIPPLVEILESKYVGQRSLESLWALNLCGGFDDARARELLDHPDPWVRLWSVRLSGDDREVSDRLAERLERLTLEETVAEVRGQLASTARRLPVDQALPIIRALTNHDEDRDDPHIPLLLWWAVEAKVDEAPEAGLALGDDPGYWERPLVREALRDRLMARFARAGSRADMLHAAALLERAPTNEHARRLVERFEQAVSGRSLTGLPDRLVQAIAQSGGASVGLRLRQGDPQALDEAIKLISDDSTSEDERIALIQTMGEIRAEEAVPILIERAQSDPSAAVRAAALAALRPFDRAEIAEAVLAMIDAPTPDDVFEAALGLLVSRASWTLRLLEAVEDGRLPADRIPAETVRKMLRHDDARIAKAVRNHWGELTGATTEEMRAQMRELGEMLTVASGNPYVGKSLYQQTCGKCHRLFDEGGDIGPDLTSYQRDDLDALLLAIVNPSAEIREGFETYVALLEDGRIASGFLVDQDDHILVLRDADGRNQLLPRDEIEAVRQVPESVMPAGLLDGLGPQEIRDLFAYLRGSQPLND